jgi:lycopene cyclase domain-containing protein
MSTYLLVNLSAVLIPLIFTFHPALRFDRRYAAFWPAVLLVAALFIGWDIWFTSMGVWGFNAAHLSGLYLFNLPVEEVLFFICIPYACVFTYHCFQKLYAPRPGPVSQRAITVVLSAALLILAVVHLDRSYTAMTFSLLAATILILQFVTTARWLGGFYFSYLVLLVPFFIVNGILTGTGLREPVVWYDDAENLGVRLFTIPVEDVFYGMLLVLWVVWGMESIEKKRARA